MFVNIENNKISFQKFGSSGTQILIVHGWGGSSNSMLELGKLLAKDFRVYLIDLPGFGNSSNPGDNWGVKDYADLVMKFTEKLEIKDFFYIGHSFGGGLGIVIASMYKSLLKGLVLLAPAYYREPKESNSSQKLKEVFPGYSKIKKYLYIPRKIYYKIFYPNSDAMSTPKFENVYRNIIKSDLREYVAKIDLPTYMIWGKKDTYTPIEYSYYLIKNLKNIEYKIFNNFSHGFPLKYPEKIHPLIYEFISKCT